MQFEFLRLGRVATSCTQASANLPHSRVGPASPFMAGDWKVAWIVPRLIAGALGFVIAGSVAAETITYTYDARGRLVKVEVAGGQADGTQTAYKYDAAGNRIQVTTTGSPNNGTPVGSPQPSNSKLRIAFNGRFFVQKR